MKKGVVLLNHDLTDKQKNELLEKYEISTIIPLPNYLQELWKNIPPEIESLQEFLKPVIEFISSALQKDDLLLVQGEHGATYWVVKKAMQYGIVTLHATSQRISVTDSKGNKVSRFEHMRFRRYE